MEKFVMWVLVLLPILNIYRLPFGPDIQLGSVIVLITFILCWMQKKKVITTLPKAFLFYWIYVGVDYFFLTLDNFKISNLIPGGLDFFIWVFTLSFVLCYFDYNSFRKYYRCAFGICAAILFYQEISYMLMGNRPLFILPLPLSGQVSSEYLINSQQMLNRSSAFFREPSQFAQYALVLLAIEMFEGRKHKRFISKYCGLIIVSLLVLRSGNGFLGLSVLFLAHTIQYFKKVKAKSRIVTLFLIFPILFFMGHKYLSSESGREIMERLSQLGTDSESESFDRTFRGYVLYATLPFINKIIGISHDNLVDFISHSPISILFLRNTADGSVSDTYVNGIQHVLIHYGAIGLFLFLFVLFKLYKNNEALPKMLVLLFFIMMFVGNQYASHLMLLAMVFAIMQQIKISKQIINTNQ